MKFIKTIEKIHIYLLFFGIGLALIPAAFFPPSIILFALTLLLLATKVMALIPTGKLELSFGKYDKALFLLTLVYLVGGILRTPSKMDFLVDPGTGTAFVCGFLVYFFLSALTPQDREKVKPFLLGSASLVAIFSAVTRTGVLAKIAFLPEVVKPVSTLLAGEAASSLVFNLVVIPWAIREILGAKKTVSRVISGALLVILVLGATASLASILPTAKKTELPLPSFGLSWSVAVDALKDNPLLGSGPGNYLAAFKKFRPGAFNKTSLWNTSFVSARNYYLTAATETGVLGILALGFLLLFLGRQVDSLVRRAAANWRVALTPKVFNYLPLTLLLASLFFFPGTVALTFLLFVLFALVNEETSKKTIKLTIATMPLANKTKETFLRKLPAILVTAALGLVILGLFFVLAAVLAAEIYFQRAVGHIAANEGRETYTTLQRAIALNPFADKYRITYAQINLVLAESIVKQGNVSSQQRSLVAELSQQAVREAKAAVAINPQKAANWETLGTVYKVIMNYAQGADAFAIAAFTKAIALDPVNPNLRIALGSVYYAKNNWDKAIDAFKFAIMAKPDLADAHYNLALAFKQKGDKTNAGAEFREALRFVPQGSDEYNLIKAELVRLR